jgi:hypothetical protein
MSSQYSHQDVIDAITEGDLTRLKAVLAVAEQHLLTYGDVATMAELLRVEISKLERHQG